MAGRDPVVDHERPGGAAIRVQVGVKNRHDGVAGVKSEFRGARLARQAALKNAGVGSVELDVPLQAFAGSRTGLECEDADAAALPVKENRGQSDIGAGVEYA